MKTTSSLLRWSITLVTCGAVAVALYYVNQGQASASASEQPPEFPEMIEAVDVSSTLWSPKTKALGEVVATRSLTLRNELEGTIIGLDLPSGGLVSKGQTLIQLDISEESARLANAKAGLELAEIELKRNKNLYKKGIASQDNFDRARIQVTIKQAELQAIQSLINKKTIKAPFDAITGLHTLEVGQYLSANSQLNTLVGLDDKIWVDFKLPQQYANIQTESEVQIQSPFSDTPIVGSIIAKDTSLNKAARSLTFRAQVDNPQQTLQPGTVVSVITATAEPTTALKIPTSAILRDQFANYVYLLSPAKDNKNYRANRQDVTLGDEYGSDTVVLSGLNMNDKIVSIGAFKLRANSLVTFDPSSPSLDQTTN